MGQSESLTTDRAGHILIVEDNDLLRDLLVRFFGDEAGFRVETVGDGAAAIRRLNTGPLPDVILSDVMMPMVDGFQLLARAKEEHPSVPVIMMSASNCRVEAFRRGCDDYLEKPFELSELTEAMARWLHPASPRTLQ